MRIQFVGLIHKFQTKEFIIVVYARKHGLFALAAVCKSDSAECILDSPGGELGRKWGWTRPRLGADTFETRPK